MIQHCKCRNDCNSGRGLEKNAWVPYHSSNLEEYGDFEVEFCNCNITHKLKEPII